MNSLSLKPEEIQIRKMNFALSEEILKEFIEKDPIRAHFLNSLSALFPVGERFFIDSVKYFTNDVKESELSMSMKHFVGQEGSHTNQHIKYNQLLEKCGYDIAHIDFRLEKRIAAIKKILSPKQQLASTLGFEHYTAVLAEQMLSDEIYLKNAHPEYARLWRWHAMEELEHKSVAFDVYESIGGGYFRRIRAMIMISMFFIYDVVSNMIYFLRKDGKLFHIPTMAKGIMYFWIYPGIFTRALPSILKYFIPGFHPWKKNNFYLITEWKNQIN